MSGTSRRPSIGARGSAARRRSQHRRAPPPARSASRHRHVPGATRSPPPRAAGDAPSRARRPCSRREPSDGQAATRPASLSRARFPAARSRSRRGMRGRTAGCPCASRRTGLRPVRPLGRRRMLGEHRGRPDRARREVSAAVRADAREVPRDARRAERALVGADHRIGRVRRKRRLTALAGWSKLEHVETSLEAL